MGKQLLLDIEAENLSQNNSINSSDKTKEEEKSVFNLYKQVRDIGKEIKDDLLSDKALILDDRETKGYKFTMNKEATRSGILDKAYGIFLLTTLLDVNGFDVDFTKAEKQKLSKSIVALLDYVKTYGYDATPYAKVEDNRAIFTNSGVSFIESLTWCFSCFLFAHKLQKREKGDFDFGESKADIDKTIVDALKILIDNVIRADGELGWTDDNYKGYLGWGAVTGCTEVSLYFTNSVCETYGDLEDTIIGNEEQKIEKDVEYINKINHLAGYDIVERFEKICKIVGENTYKKYGEMLGSDFFYEDGSIASKGQIEYSAQSPVLLNQLYAIMVPIFTNYHVVLGKQDSKAFELMQIKFKDGVDLVYKEYNELRNKDKEGIVNRDPVSFYGVIKDKKYASIMSNERINTAVLEALIVRARAMIVSYVTKYPEKELGTIVTIIEQNRPNDEKWIWGNLQETERSVSALKEFFDYYNKYEKDYAMSRINEEERNKIKEAEINQQKEKLKADHDANTKQLKKKHETEINELKRKIDELNAIIDNGSPIEREIQRSINECVEEKLDTVFIDRINKICSKNMDDSIELTEQEMLFKRSIDMYVQSYLAGALAHSKNEIDSGDLPEGYQTWTNEEILRKAKIAMDKFLGEMIPFFVVASNDVVGFAEQLQTIAKGNNKKH